MEGSLAVKRRRLYSLEPNKRAEAMFARKYVGYLVPALTKMKEQTSLKKEHLDSSKKLMKYEVDMALVLSAQGSAWSNALKLRLQQQVHIINVQNNGVLSSTTTKRDSDDQNPTVMVTTTTEEDKEEDGEEEKQMMKRLRSLVPGGEEICNDQQMLAELKSYVRCLQMQVNILQCLALTH